MIKILRLNRIVLGFSIPFFLLMSLVLIISYADISEISILPLAITIDLLVLVPLVYFFLIRKTSIPKTTVIPVILIGFFLGMVFLPKQNQGYLELFKIWVLPALELGIITFVIFKLRKAFRYYKLLKNDTPDFFNVLKQTCSQIVPKKLVVPLATEIAVFYYGFLSWKSRKLRKNEFSYHKESGSQALMFGIVMVIGVETYVLHLFLMKWSEIVAYIILFLSIYTSLQFIGFAKSISQRPHIIEKDRLILRYGMVNEAIIPLEFIESVEILRGDIEKDSDLKSLSLLRELESPNVLLKVGEKHEFESLYGFKKKYKSLTFYVDEASDFVEIVEKNKRGNF